MRASAWRRPPKLEANSLGLFARRTVWLAIDCTVASVFFTRCDSSAIRRCCSRSALLPLGDVPSDARSTDDVAAVDQRTGETGSERSISRPSCAMRWVSKCPICVLRSPTRAQYLIRLPERVTRGNDPLDGSPIISCRCVAEHALRAGIPGQHPPPKRRADDRIIATSLRSLRAAPTAGRPHAAR